MRRLTTIDVLVGCLLLSACGSGVEPGDANVSAELRPPDMCAAYHAHVLVRAPWLKSCSQRGSASTPTSTPTS